MELDRSEPFLPPKEVPLSKALPPPKEPIAVVALPEAIQAAAAKKIDTEFAPFSEHVSTLMGDLQIYRDAHKLEIERMVLNKVLEVLGLDPQPEHPTLAGTTQALRRSLTAMCLHLGGVDPFVMPVVESSDPLPADGTPEDAQKQTLVRFPRPEDQAHAERLIQEIEKLRTDAQYEHASRLEHHLQAVVAECRWVQECLPDTYWLHKRIGTYYPILSAIRFENGVQGFIKGLSPNSVGPWDQIAAQARAKVEHFDSAHVPGTVKKKKQGKDDSTSSPAWTWPAWEALRKMLETKQLAMVGGVVIPEKVNLIKTRFGLDATWIEVTENSSRSVASVEAQIRSGTIGALVLLEGLVGHATSNRITAACKAAKVPQTLAVRGGTGALEAAFADLNHRLSCNRWSSHL